MTIKSRQAYYRSMPGCPNDPVVIRLLDDTGAVISEFSEILVDRFMETDTEAIQSLISSDGEKMYSFDRIVLSIVLTGFLRDSVSNPAFSRWRRFYETARASAAVKLGRSVSISFKSITTRGLLSASSHTTSSMTPFSVQLSLTMLCYDFRSAEAPSPIDGTDIIGSASRESLERLGIFPSAISPTNLSRFASPVIRSSGIAGIADYPTVFGA